MGITSVANTGAGAGAGAGTSSGINATTTNGESRASKGKTNNKNHSTGKTSKFSLDCFMAHLHPPEKYGSLQHYVRHLAASEDYGPSRFSKGDCHRIMNTDIRLINQDRHGGNILVSEQKTDVMLYPRPFKINGRKNKENDTVNNSKSLSSPEKELEINALKTMENKPWWCTTTTGNENVNSKKTIDGANPLFHETYEESYSKKTTDETQGGRKEFSDYSVPSLSDKLSFQLKRPIPVL